MPRSASPSSRPGQVDTSGLFCGVVGCAIIRHSVLNVSAGGQERLSCLWAGMLLLSLAVVLDPWMKQISMPALVSVTIMVLLNTSQWRSNRTLVTNPKSPGVVMPATVAGVVAIHDPAFGITSALDGATGTRVCRATDQASLDTVFFHNAFGLLEELRAVVLDMHAAHFWVTAGIDARDRVMLKFRRHDVPVGINGMDEARQTLVGRLALHGRQGAALTAAVP